MILLVHAHPQPSRSIANRALLDAVRALPGVLVHSLYDRYPDFSIDVAAEQAALAQAHTLVWQHPTYWYGAPALLALWLEKVLTRGWAYGAGGTALAGKRVLWATTTGNLADQIERGELEHMSEDDFSPSLKFTARYCGMTWQPPFVVHRAHRLAADDLARRAQAYRARLQQLVNDVPDR
ncbi:MAG: NAD(P)H-dependent oxidoreductase [Burkholderiaceae bacterium]|nr:NAD(P)H-dependent oxidoreductase [Burkholderiaceae bacterium]